MEGLGQREWVLRHAPVDSDQASYEDDLNGEISERLARLLEARGLRTPAAREAFLNPRLADLIDPMRVPGVDAVARFLLAADRSGPVLIYGDYDVDGITSVVLLKEVLERIKVPVVAFIPDRFEHGYGLSEAGIEEALRVCPESRCMIALDCGTNSRSLLRRLEHEGYQVAVVDHHQPLEGVDWEDADVMVNPAIFPGELEQDSSWCTVGLVFKVVQRLYRILADEDAARLPEVPLGDFLDLVALGSIADLVTLRGENRILVHYGLRRLSRTARPGLVALLQEGSIRDLPVRAEDVAFRLAPRLNAAGRLAHAGLAVDLLDARDQRQAYDQAQNLSRLNGRRQRIEEEVFLEAQAQADRYPVNDAGLVLYHEDWHPGVLGIVAGKLARQRHRPCIVLGGAQGLLQGSGRSVEGLDLVAVLEGCGEAIRKWGGHPMAVGLTVETERVGALRTLFSEAVARVLGKSPPRPPLLLDAWLSTTDLGPALIKEMEWLQPFGVGNPEPVFGMRVSEPVRSVRPVGKDHYRFLVGGDDGWVAGIHWRGLANPLPSQSPFELAFKAKVSQWQGRRSLQLEVVEWRPVSDAGKGG